MAKILKSVAIAAGAGLAMGLTTMAPSRKPERRVSAPSVSHREDDILDLEPVLDRLEALERRLERVDAKTAAAAEPAAPAAESEHRFEEQVRELRAEIPALVTSGVEARIAAIEARIEAELAAQRRQTFEALGPLIDARIQQTMGPLIEAGIARQVGQRFEALERAVAEQSLTIGVLRERVEQTDLNLQRLITTIERLIDGGQNSVIVPAPAPANASFQTHLAEAMDEGAAPAAVPVPEFRSNIFREPDPKDARKPRFPMSRIFGALMAFGLARFFH